MRKPYSADGFFRVSNESDRTGIKCNKDRRKELARFPHCRVVVVTLNQDQLMSHDRLFTIVGGAGFIGTRLCQLMAEYGMNFEIVDLRLSRSFPDRSRIADIRNLEMLREAIRGDTIINLAAIHRDDVPDPREYYITNAEGTRNLCILATERAIDTVVFTSTCAVYGFCPPDTDENGVANPFNDYGRSKLEGETVLEAWYAEAPVTRNVTILRPTVVFGEGNRGNVYNLLNLIARGRFLMVGNGKNRKSMAYVGNVAQYLLYAATQVKGFSRVNYVDKPDFTMNSLVMKVREVLEGTPRIGPRLPYFLGLGLGYIADSLAWLLGKRLPISSIRVKKFCMTTCFSSAATDQPGFLASFTLEEGLMRTLEEEFINPDPARETFFCE